MNKHSAQVRTPRKSTITGSLFVGLGIVLFGLLLTGTALAQEGAKEGAEPGSAVLGKNAYRSYCSSCHGAEGAGDGTLASVLTVEPTDLTRLAAENDGVFPRERTRQVIDGRKKVKGHGDGEMPAWGDAFSQIESSEEGVQKRIADLVAFLESIQK